MLKQFVFVPGVVFCVCAISFAKDKTDSSLKEPHQKVETNYYVFSAIIF